MALLTFTPPRAPKVGSRDAPKLKLLKAEFGDGYTQAAAQGLNHIRREMTLNWDGLTPTQADAMIAFFVARGGYESFYWTPSNEATPVKWTCETWENKSMDGGLREVSATFVQSFNLSA